jgi:hypothetical protein
MITLIRKFPKWRRRLWNLAMDFILAIMPSLYKSSISFGYDKKYRIVLANITVHHSDVDANGRNVEGHYFQYTDSKRPFLSNVLKSVLQPRIRSKITYKNEIVNLILFKSTWQSWVIVGVYCSGATIDHQDLGRISSESAEKIYFEYHYKLAHIHEMK